MKIYAWHPKTWKYERPEETWKTEEPNWQQQRIEWSSEFKGRENELFHYKPGPNTIAYVKFDPETKEFSLLWHPDQYPSRPCSGCLVDNSHPPSHERVSYTTTLDERYMTIPNAIYYMVGSKGGPTYFAVVEEEALV